MFYFVCSGLLVCGVFLGWGVVDCFFSFFVACFVEGMHIEGFSEALVPLCVSQTSPSAEVELRDGKPLPRHSLQGEVRPAGC